MYERQREPRRRRQHADPRVERERDVRGPVEEDGLALGRGVANQPLAEFEFPLFVAGGQAEPCRQRHPALPLVVLVKSERTVAGLVRQHAQHLRRRRRRLILLVEGDHHARADAVPARAHLELLVLPRERGLGHLALADVVQEPGVGALAVDPHLGHRQLERHAASVLARPHDLAADADELGVARIFVVLEVAVVPAVIRLRHQHLDVLAEHLARRVAEDLLRPPIEGRDGPDLVDHEDAVEHGVEHGARARLQARALGGRALGCADVSNNGEDLEDSPRRVAMQRQAQRDVDLPTVPSPADRFELVDGLAAHHSVGQLGLLACAFGRDDARQGLPQHFLGRVAEHVLGALVPARDAASERLADDRVAGGFDDRRQSPPRLLSRFALGDVLGDPEQIAWHPGPVQEGDLLRVQQARAALGLNGLFRDIDEHPGRERLAVLRLEELGILLGKQIAVRLAEQIAPRTSEEGLAGAIEAHEREALRVLDEDHVGDVLEDGLEELVGLSSRLVDALAFCDVVRDGIQRPRCIGGSRPDEPAIGAILAPVAVLEGDRRYPAGQLFDLRESRGPVLGVDEIDEGP